MKKVKRMMILKGSCMCHGSWESNPIDVDMIISNDKYYMPVVTVIEIFESITTLEDVPGCIEFEPVE